MLSILEPIFLLLIVIVHIPLNTFGGTMPEDALTVQKFENRIELMEKNILKAISEQQNSIPGNFLGDGRNQKEKNSQNYDVSEFHSILTTVRSQEEKNLPNYDVSEFHNILTTVRSQEKKNSPKYDEHFNCIGNCRSEDESCSSATLRNESKDGVYLLKAPKPVLKPFYVYCHHENKNETAWTIIQRRQGGSVNFNRNWLEYQLGFGDLNGEYWIGLERLHQITTSCYCYELLILLYTFEKEKGYAKYWNFDVGSEHENYKLNVGGYSGNIGDAFGDNYEFTTFDRMRGEGGEYRHPHIGGWWKCRWCNPSPNLNGQPLKWNSREFRSRSLHKVIMAIRPVGV